MNQPEMDAAVRDWLRFFQEDYHLTSDELESAVTRALRAHATARSTSSVESVALPGTPVEGAIDSTTAQPNVVTSTMGQVPACQQTQAPTPRVEDGPWWEADIRPIARCIMVSLVAFAAHSKNRFLRFEALVPLLCIYAVFLYQLMQQIRAEEASPSYTAASTTRRLDMGGHVLVVWSSILALPGLWEDEDRRISACSVTWLVGVVLWVWGLFYYFHLLRQSDEAKAGDAAEKQPMVAVRGTS
uniref:Uncharacterized protein n=1 Tax=uncultured SAR11 cluster alpha proteobacterium H17925_45G17 TaxID=715038 RepID=E7CA47_9PROT|nr:hypothetical protein [uncultured SAR11 cluster alpha proteobacterium H17925_45G17]